MNMKKYLTHIAMGTLLLSQVALAGTPIDVDRSKVEWLGEKVMGQHNGNLQLKKGEVEIENRTLVAGRLVFDMKSINVLDIKDPKKKGNLEKHLKDDAFFGVAQYPFAIFEITSAVSIQKAGPGEENYEIQGELTIKGITHAVSFKTLVDIKSKRSSASGKIIVDRTLYGIRYGSGKFFDGLGDKAIYDDFVISFDVLTK